MTYDLKEAHLQLTQLVQGGSVSKAELLHLISQIDITAEGNVTVLYSGNIHTTESSSIAKAMAIDPSLRVIDKTDAAIFLQSKQHINRTGIK